MMLQLSRRLLLPVVLGICSYGFFLLPLCAGWSPSSKANGWRTPIPRSSGRSGTSTVVLQQSSSSSSSSPFGINRNVSVYVPVSDRSDAIDKQQPQQEQEPPFSFQIQKCQYADLNPVSDIIMDSFYDTKTSWKRLLKLAELNRLQQNFPYIDTDLHQMFVAIVATQDPPSTTTTATTTTISRPRTVIGFVDIDARPCRPEIPLPRPYLSDLAVHPNYRRRGIAKALIQACEDFCRQIPRKELFIRVEETNHAAVQMYMDQLQYQSQGVEVEPREKKRILILHKSLVLPKQGSEMSGSTIGRASASPSTTTDSTATSSALLGRTAMIRDDDQEFVI